MTLGPGRSRIALLLAGCFLVALNLAGLHFQKRDNLPGFIVVALAQGIPYLVGAWIVLRDKPVPGALSIVLLFATILRLSIIFSPVYLSSDIFRYIWDGRVQGAGINPYRYIPADEALEELRDDSIFPYINRVDYAPTAYPPVAEGVLFAATRISESVSWMKLVMVGFEGIAIWIVMKLLVLFHLPRDRVLLYAWHPLAVWEFAGSGHLDAIAIAFLVLALWARKRDLPVLTGASLACATLTKFYVAIAFPALYRKWDWKMPAAFAGTTILAYLPYLGVGRHVLGFLPGYLSEEDFLSGERFYVLNVLDKLTRDRIDLDIARYVPLLALVLIVLGVYILFRKTASETGYLKGATALGIAFCALVSPHYPWYFVWVVPLLCFVPFWPMLVLSVCGFLLYETSLGGTPEMLFRINTTLYSVFVLLSAYYWLVSRRRKSTQAS